MGAAPKTIPNEFVERGRRQVDQGTTELLVGEIAVRVALDFVTWHGFYETEPTINAFEQLSVSVRHC